MPWEPMLMLCFIVLSHKAICSDFYLHCKKDFSLSLILSVSPFSFFLVPISFLRVCMSTNNTASIHTVLFVYICKKIHKGWLNLTIRLLRKLRLRIFCKSPKPICPSDCKSSDLPLNFLSHHLWTTEDRGLFLLENNFILTSFYTYWVRCLIFFFYSVVLSFSLGKFHLWCKTTDYIILLVIDLIHCESCLLFFHIGTFHFECLLHLINLFSFHLPFWSLFFSLISSLLH